MMNGDHPNEVIFNVEDNRERETTHQHASGTGGCRLKRICARSCNDAVERRDYRFSETLAVACPLGFVPIGTRGGFARRIGVNHKSHNDLLLSWQPRSTQGFKWHAFDAATAQLLDATFEDGFVFDGIEWLAGCIIQ
jgi:hypothetical protein